MIENIKPTSRLVVDLEMYQVDYNEQKKEALRKQIAEKYNVPLKNVSVELKPIMVAADGSKLSLTSDIIKSVQDPKLQQQLFRDYVELQGIEDVDFDAILKIDDSINAFIDFDSYSKFKNYKLKYIKWSNYLSYGPDNYVDFTKLHGLVLLNGSPENQSGKTTFSIDLPRFGLFGKAKKSPNLSTVFNTYLKETTEVKVEEGIEIDGQEYVIRRTITRPPLKRRTPKSKPKQTIEYFRKVGDSMELIENCEEENVSQTNNVIRESVGSLEDFNLVISANVKTLGDLLELNQSDRSRIFSRWLGLVTIEEKERIAKEHYKNKIAPNLKSNAFNIHDVQTQINDMKTIIESNEKRIVVLTAEEDAQAKAIENLKKERDAIIATRRPINDAVARIDVVTLERSIEGTKNELADKRKLFQADKEEYLRLKDVVYDQVAHAKVKEEIRAIEFANNTLRANMAHINAEIAHKEDTIRKGVCAECGQPVTDDGVTRQIVEQKRKEVEGMLAKEVENNKRLAELVASDRQMENNRLIVDNVGKLKLRLSALKVQMDNIKLRGADLDKQKAEIEKNKENLRYNNEVNNKARSIDERIRVETNIKESKIREIQRYRTEIENTKRGIEGNEKMLEILKKEAKIIRDWNIYQQLVGKNGIVKIVLKRALPILNNEIARLLNGLCDFDVVLSVDENNKVCMDLVRDGERLDMTYACSGFEGTISALALRCALSNIAALSKPNFLTLDEILGGISPHNMENIMTLFKRVLHSYDFILHICHDSTIVDYHDQILTVSKQDNVSVIELK